MSTVDEVRCTSVGEDGMDLPLVGIIVDNIDAALFDEQRRRADVVRLAGRFVERVIGDALDARRRLHPEAPAPEVDWDALWATGARCASVEQAVGRVVVAAESLARNIARGTTPPRTHTARARLSPPVPAIEPGSVEIVFPARNLLPGTATPAQVELPTFEWGPGDVVPRAARGWVGPGRAHLGRLGPRHPGAPARDRRTRSGASACTPTRSDSNHPPSASGHGVRVGPQCRCRTDPLRRVAGVGDEPVPAPGAGFAASAVRRATCGQRRSSPQRRRRRPARRSWPRPCVCPNRLKDRPWRISASPPSASISTWSTGQRKATCRRARAITSERPCPARPATWRSPGTAPPTGLRSTTSTNWLPATRSISPRSRARTSTTS